MFYIVGRRGDPGRPHATRDECFAIIDGMVRDGIAEVGEFSVIEIDDESGRQVGPPMPAPSGAGLATTA